MGMFNYIKVKYALPGCSSPEDIQWQTKDVEPLYLQTYFLDVDGQLYLLPDDRDDDSDPGWRTDFTGDMRLIGYDKEKSNYVEYVVRMVGGKADSAAVVERRVYEPVS